MKIKASVKYLVIAICTVLLCSCEIDVSIGPEDENSANNALCQYGWYTNYTDFDDAHINHQIKFYTNGEGKEIIIRSLFGQADSHEYFFNWYWVSDSYTSICMEYGENDISYLDHIFIQEYELTCVLNGENLSFYGR